ncbi:hypothetical protein F183_A29650 [Bryobacterales bacterium F-183]|nr:hypothetical protein F183_A29650 [Bryobacterales bacterium F-183]
MKLYEDLGHGRFYGSATGYVHRDVEYGDSMYLFAYHLTPAAVTALNSSGEYFAMGFSLDRVPEPSQFGFLAISGIAALCVRRIRRF